MDRNFVALAIRTRISFGVALAVTVLAATPTLARSSGCFANGDVVSFDGTATPGGHSAWVLNLSRPMCVGNHDISSLRIIGTPPPLGVPLELTGKLLLGRVASESRMFVALVVRSGRRIGSTQTIASPRSPAPSLRVSVQCDAPPYGGTAIEYRAFVRRFGTIIKPEKILSGVCNAKFGHSPRDGLHKLGLTDATINSESTERLAVDTIVALKRLVNTIE